MIAVASAVVSSAAASSVVVSVPRFRLAVPLEDEKRKKQ
jgi:hypothetical protein